MTKFKKIIFFWFVIAAVHGAYAQTVCLNMIVRDEATTIERCLASVKGFIDYWVIVDTGSKDGTQEIIKKFMRDIPGELYERPWVDFAHNRNEALVFAKGTADYVLFMDADDTLRFAERFRRPYLDKDLYFFSCQMNGGSYLRSVLINNRLEWRWEGVVHEVIRSRECKSSQVLQGVTMLAGSDGSRGRDPKKYEKDALLLEKALEKEPGNTRYVFYLAQSYRDAGKYPQALKNYQKRAAMGGWQEEVFWSLLQVGMLQEDLGMSYETISESYTRASQCKPDRIEPLYHLARYVHKNGNHLIGYTIIKHALSIPLPEAAALCETWMYQYGAMMLFAECAFHAQRYAEAKEALQFLLSNPSLPHNQRAAMQQNLELLR